MVRLMASAVEEALPTLVGKPLRIDHPPKGVTVGTIYSAALRKGWLRVEGEAWEELPEWGFSWEVEDVQVEDIRAREWRIVKIGKFQGMALVKKPSAESEIVHVY